MSLYTRIGAYLAGTLARGETVRADYDAIKTAFDSVETSLGRSLRLSEAIAAVTATAAGRANKVWGFDASGAPVLVANASFTQNLNRRNLFVNGACRVVQGAAVTISASRQYGLADGWTAYSPAGAPSAGSFTAITALGSAVSGIKAGALHLSGVTHTSGKTIVIGQRIESLTTRQLRATAMTVSVKFRHTAASTLSMSIHAVAAGALNDWSAPVSIGNSTAANYAPDTTHTVSWSFTPTESGYDTGNGFEIQFHVGFNSDETTINVYLGEMQIEPGSSATEFEVLPFRDDFANCQRLYQKSYPHTTAVATATANGAVMIPLNESQTAGGSFIYGRGSLRLPVTMRTTPTARYWDLAGNLSKVTTYVAAGTATDNVTPSTGSPVGTPTHNNIIHNFDVPGGNEGVAAAFHYDLDARL